MTLTLPRHDVVGTPAPPRHKASRTRSRESSRHLALAHLLPVLLVAGVASAVGLTRAPQRIDDEGTYVAQAYAVTHFGELAHYTYWYDHPPLGWLQLAAYSWLTDAFSRHDYAVFAGREAMVVAHVVSVGLLWLLARRVGVSRVGATVAGLVYALSPLAVQFDRTVYLDNVAVPWMLAAFVLATSRHRQLPAFAVSAVCMGVAILSKETFLLLLPFVAWQMWRGAHPQTRRYTLTVAGSLLALIGLAYVGFAMLKGELLPGPNRVSLVGGLAFQLFGRTASGSVLDASSQAGGVLRSWLHLDPVLALTGVVAGAAGLLVRRLRPLAAGFVLLALFELRPGYLPVPYVIAMIPLAALLVPAVVDHVLRSGRRRLAAVTAVLAMAATAVAVPSWAGQLRGMWSADPDAPLKSAQAWLANNVDPQEKVLVDDAIWVDLVKAGIPRRNVVWYYKADTDPAVRARAPKGWRSYAYLISTESLRSTAEPSPTLRKAYHHSTPVATFGQGDQRVTVRSIGDAPTSRPGDPQQSARARAGRALLQNPHLELAPPARAALTRGRVAGGLMAQLAQWAADRRVAVARFPVADGEEADVLRHTMWISAVDGQRPPSRAVTAFADAAEHQSGGLGPRQATVEGDRLVVSFRLATAAIAPSAVADPAASGQPGTVTSGWARLVDVAPRSAGHEVRLARFRGGPPALLRDGQYGDVTPYHRLFPGFYSLATRDAGSAAWNLTATVDVGVGDAYTVLAAGTSSRGAGNEGSISVLHDFVSAPPPGEARVRIIDGMSAQGPSTVRTARGETLAEGLENGSATGYANVREQGWKLRVGSGGGSALVTTVHLRADQVYTLLVLDGPRRLVPLLDARVGDPGVSTGHHAGGP